MFGRVVNGVLKKTPTNQKQSYGLRISGLSFGLANWK